MLYSYLTCSCIFVICILVHVLSLHIISHMLIYISITCKLFHVLSLHIIPLNYLYIAPHAYLPIISLACVLTALIYTVLHDKGSQNKCQC